MVKWCGITNVRRTGCAMGGQAIIVARRITFYLFTHVKTHKAAIKLKESRIEMCFRIHRKQSSINCINVCCAGGNPKSSDWWKKKTKHTKEQINAPLKHFVAQLATQHDWWNPCVRSFSGPILPWPCYSTTFQRMPFYHRCERGLN